MSTPRDNLTPNLTPREALPPRGERLPLPMSLPAPMGAMSLADPRAGQALSRRGTTAYDEEEGEEAYQDALVGRSPRRQVRQGTGQISTRVAPSLAA